MVDTRRTPRRFLLNTLRCSPPPHPVCCGALFGLFFPWSGNPHLFSGDLCSARGALLLGGAVAGWRNAPRGLPNPHPPRLLLARFSCLFYRGAIFPSDANWPLPMGDRRAKVGDAPLQRRRALNSAPTKLIALEQLGRLYIYINF